MLEKFLVGNIGDYFVIMELCTWSARRPAGSAFFKATLGEMRLEGTVPVPLKRIVLADDIFGSALYP